MASTIVIDKEKNQSHKLLSGWIGLGFILFIHTMMILPALFFLNQDVWIAEAWDSNKGHIPAINYFIANPTHLFSYPSIISTFPGYHLFLALIASLFGMESVNGATWLIRIINIAFAYGLVIMVWQIVWRLKQDVQLAFALLLPLALSYYVLASSIWINTDDVAAFFYVTLIFIFMFNQSSLMAAFMAFFMVICRQIYFPVVGAFWPPALWPKFNKTYARLALAVSLLTSLTILIYLWRWQGLTPGRTQTINKFIGINLSGLLHAFTLTGLWSIPYLFIFCADRLSYKKYFYFLIFIAIGLALLLWGITPSNFDYDEGRGGSIVWYLANLTPSYEHHSFFVLLFSAVGMFVMLNMIMRSIAMRYYPIETIMLLAYFLSCSTQIFSFQRYVEIPILITFAVFGARIKNYRRLNLLGPIALAIIFVVLASIHMWLKVHGGTIAY